MSTELSEKDLAECKKEFDVYDLNGDGNISVEELGIVFRSLGENPTEADLQQFIALADEDGNGVLSFNEFIKLWTFQNKNRPTKEKDQEELLEGFKSIDKDGSGFISAADFRFIMTHCGEPVSDEQVDDLIRYADVDGDGKINYMEFVKLLTAKK